MRSAYLDDAEPEVLSHTVRHILEERGALVSEHRHSRVRFHGLQPDRWSWSRAGYVGVYQHQGETETEVRLLLRARWPWRSLWTIALVDLVIVLATMILNPPGTTWSILSILTGGALLLAGLVYIGTLRSVRSDEEGLMKEFESAFAALPEVDLETDEERELRELEAELEGEVARRRFAAITPAREKGSRFSLRPRRAKEPPASAETVEERRARLLARKAELEARKREEP